MRVFVPATIVTALAVLSGCAADKCEELPAQAQIDVKIEGNLQGDAHSSEVVLTINGEKEVSHSFPKAAPSFLFEFGDYDRPPRTVAISVAVKDKEGRVLGTGALDTTFSADGCNFLTVEIKPGGGPDGGQDAGLPDGGQDGEVPDGGQDAGLPDGGQDAGLPDGGQDVGVPDQGAPDAATDDTAPPDGPTGDVSLQDAPVPDSVVYDAPVPDSKLPDTAQSDAPQPDAQPPDLQTADSTTDLQAPDTGAVVPGTWVTIPPTGTTLPVTFSMGSPVGEPCREPWIPKETEHQVTLTRSFEISVYEVTQGEFGTEMGYNPSNFKSCGLDCPVEKVSWHEAVWYCNALSTKKGLTACYSCNGSGPTVSCTEVAAYSGQKIFDCPGYRLPTEAEWEYTYRAGSGTAFYPSTGNNGAITNCTTSDANADKIGWYMYNSAVSYAGCYDLSSNGGDPCSGTHPKGTKAGNAWGLFDMAGNVWEWCHDWYQDDLGPSATTDPWGAASGTYRVLRGGSWDNYPNAVRAANRLHYYDPSKQFSTCGFRCVRTIP